MEQEGVGGGVGRGGVWWVGEWGLGKIILKMWGRDCNNLRKNPYSLMETLSHTGVAGLRQTPIKTITNHAT